MFTPEEIEHKEFVATMRGYDRDEVAAFLRAVAEDVRRLQALAEERPLPVPVAVEVAEPEPVDLEAMLGSQVADIIRTARAAAEANVESTEKAMAELKADAERHALQVRGEASRHADESRREAERLMERARAEANRLVAEAREQADDLLQEAMLRQERIEVSNRSTLAAMSHVERQMAELRHAFEASFELTRPAMAALEASSTVTPISSAPSAVTG